MKNMKKCLALLPALLLALSLAACGGDSSTPVDEPPASLEDMVKDSSIDADYSGFLGTWMSDDSAELIVEPSEDGDETRFALYGADGTVEASGYLQYMEEYGYVYAYNEHDGVAHQCWFDENNSLSIDSLGTFTQTTGGVDDTQAGGGNAALAGVWYLDGEAGAESIIEIDANGNWSLSERPGGDGDPTQVDGGSLQADPDNEGLYYASSSLFDDTVYDMTVVDENTMYWGGEYDCYMRIA